MDRINRFLGVLLLTACVAISCSDSGTSPEIEETEIASLEASVNYQAEVGTERTHIFDSKLADDGIVVLGAYKDLDSSCLKMKLFLLKVSFDGEELWRRKYDDIYVSKCDQIDFEITDTNGIAVFAATAYPDDFSNRDYHIYKFSSVGDLMWEQTLDYHGLDTQIYGTDKGNDELIAYPYDNNSNVFREVTFDTNGNILQDIEKPVLPSTFFSITEAPSERKLYTYNVDNKSKIEVFDKNLNPFSTIDLSFGVSYLNENIVARNGYYALNGSFLKLTSNFETEWVYNYKFSPSSIKPVEIVRDRYVIMEERSFAPGSGTAPIISVVGDGGEVLSRTIANTIDGFYPQAKKVLSRGNGDIILVYADRLDVGVTIYQNEF